MARDKKKEVTPSILDRLKADGLRQTHGQSMSQLKESVRNDLENLLNTRWRCTNWPPDLDELDLSLVNYGIPDFTGANFAANSDREQLRRIIERIVRAFEPRFKQVRISVMENADKDDRTVRFRIDALLYADPAPEQVVFDSQLEPSTCSFAVSRSGS
jgi:type VI secretion system protein ImpF